MTKKPKDKTVGPWAKEKLEALGAYLNFYTTVLKNQGHWLKGTVFVDAFAGPGLSPVRSAKKPAEPMALFNEVVASETGVAEFLKGSPRVALDIANPFSSYLFVERDSDRVADLQALKSEYGPARNITIAEGDANVAVEAWLARGIDWKHNRAVVFLDPFGMQLPWATIRKLAATSAVEVVINFPLGMAIQRLLTRSGEIPDGWQESLNACFGSPDWRQLAYEEGTDLFGSTVSKAADSSTKLLEWYRGRLREAFGHVSSARLVKNTRGNPLYYLIWAGPHKKGLDGAEHILGKPRVAVQQNARR